MSSGAAPLSIFLIAALALNISPGPDMLYVISRSLEQGRRAGIVSALGIGAGTLFHMFVVAIGLSAILINFPLAYTIVRYLGAAYLVYLGVRILVSKKTDRATETARGGGDEANSLRTVFRQGATTNILNPKVALFFLAFLPQFVDRSLGSVALQIIGLGLLFDTSGTSVNILVATLAARVSKSLKNRSSFSRFQKLLPAIILIGLGLLVTFR